MGLVEDARKHLPLINKYVDYEDSTVIKCRGCGEVVSFERTRDLLSGALLAEDVGVKYLVLKHMLGCPKHDVRIPVGGLAEYPISRTLERNIRAACEAGGRVYEVELPRIAERWRLRCGE